MRKGKIILAHTVGRYRHCPSQQRSPGVRDRGLLIILHPKLGYLSLPREIAEEVALAFIFSLAELQMLNVTWSGLPGLGPEDEQLWVP